MRYLVLTVAFSALAVACSDSDVCVDNTDCFSGNVCSDGVCVPVTANNASNASNQSANDSTNSGTNATTPNGSPNASTPNGSPNGSPNASTPNASTPNANPGPVVPTKVVAGGDFSCALMSDATVRCWGENADGRLNTALDDNELVVPEPVLGLEGVVDLTAGGKHACAVAEDRSVLCWGLNRDIDTAQTWGVVLGPTAPPTSNVQLIDSNFNYTCSAEGDGTFVSCFGRSDGDGEFAPNFTSPVDKLAVGQHHVCAIESGNVRCWGSDYYQQLGTGDPVRDLANIVDLDAGERHTCAVDTSGDVLCWGWNEESQCGTTPIEFQEKVEPQVVPGISGMVEVVAGGAFSCARNDAGRVWCWGGWDGWEPHIYTDNTVTPPVTPVGMGSGVKQLAAGWLHVCALKTDDTVWCWGANVSRQLGSDEVFRTDTPVRVQFSREN